MKYFYISLFLSITFLVIGTAASIEQKHSKAKAETELMESQDLQDDDAPEVKLTFGEKMPTSNQFIPYWSGHSCSDFLPLCHRNNRLHKVL